MEFAALTDFIMIGAVALLGAVSPGPDFVIVTKNSLTYSRRSGLYTAFGVSMAVFIHLAYSFAAIVFSLAESVFLFECIKYAGAAYLIYIGLKALFTKASTAGEQQYKEEKRDLTPMQAWKTGFFTNALNPKATLFFLSVFSQVIEPRSSLLTMLAYAFEIWLIVLLWFCLLAFLLSHQQIRKRLTHVQPLFEKGMGALLFGFGLKIAFI